MKKDKDGFIIVTRSPIRKQINLFRKGFDTIAEKGFRSGIKRHMKKNNISPQIVDRKSKEMYKKAFFALNKNQMDKVFLRLRGRR